MVDYLFGAKKEHRIQLVIVPGNAASQRIAEKCGFALEGTARGAFFNDGRNQDVLIRLADRSDPRPWQTNRGTLFVKIYDPGNVFAVTGPWRKH